MQAKNGSGASGTRRRYRLAGCLIALLLVSAMVAPSIASAKTKPVNQTYVGLGDSLAFGYSQKLFNENKPADPASAFEHGYVNDYYTLFNAKKKGRVQMVNLACPGETTESLIGNNPALLGSINAALAGKIPEAVTGGAPCGYHYTEGHPLHHEYGGTKSQLESLLEVLVAEKAAGKPVQKITLDIGGNDANHAIGAIKAEIPSLLQTKIEALAKQAAEQAAAHAVELEVKKYIETVFLPTKVGEVYGAQIAAEVEGYIFVTFLLGPAETKCEEEAIEKGEPGNGPVRCAEESPYPNGKGGYLTFLEAFAGQYYIEHKPALEAEAAKKGGEIGAADAAAYAASHEGELELEEAAFALTYAAAHEPELLGIAFAAGTLYGEEYECFPPKVNAKCTPAHKAQLELEGAQKFKAKLEAEAPSIFEQIDVNLIGILTAIRGAGFSGHITFQENWDPYGNYGSGEVLPGSNALLGALNASETAVVTKKPLKACTTDPQLIFNPGTLPAEAVQLATLSEALNGDAIHASPAGYQVLAEQMSSTCSK